MGKLNPKQIEEFKNLSKVYDNATHPTGMLGQMKELMVETMEQVKEKPMVWGQHYYESYQKLINLEMSYNIIRDRYKELYIKLYGKKDCKLRFKDLELTKDEIRYPLNDEEALFSNEKPNYMY